ncbi:TPA: DUF86 domain-containing protein [Candidatus Micrarchaeota archaeon]|nr:DUF86 domain-containing protein [Candidatus Micrarchaeota archaeon]
MKKYKFDKQRLSIIINRIEESMKELGLAFQNENDLNDTVKFNASAMSLFQAINSSIDLADDIISQCKFKIPMDYRETFEIIHKEGAIDEAVLKKIKELTYYRNLIAHEYYRITREQLLKLIKISKAIYEYLEQMKSFIGKHS